MSSADPPGSCSPLQDNSEQEGDNSHTTTSLLEESPIEQSQGGETIASQAHPHSALSSPSEPYNAKESAGSYSLGTSLGAGVAPAASAAAGRGDSYGRLLHSTIEEDKEYNDGGGDDDKKKEEKSESGIGGAPLTPKQQAWIGGSPFVMVPPPPAPLTSSSALSRSKSEGDHALNNNNDDNEESGGELRQRSSSECSTSNSSQGKVNFSGLTRAIHAESLNKASGPTRRPLQQPAGPRPTDPNRGGVGGSRRSVGSSQPSSSSLDSRGGAPSTKQQRVQQALLKQGKNSLTMPHTFQQQLSTRSGGQAFAGDFASESNFSESDKVYEVAMRPQNTKMTPSKQLGSLLGRGSSASSINKKKSRPSFFTSKLNRRTRLAGGGTPKLRSTMMNDTQGRGPDNSRSSDEGHSNVSRRYKTGDSVLVKNAQSKWANLVNRYGFPQGEGETSEERRGPYVYVLATVKQMHFEEIHPYYTVTRCDTGAEQRADAHFMEPLRTQRGEMAALRAATESSSAARGAFRDESSNINESSRTLQPAGKCATCIQSCIFYMLLPFLWILDCINYVWDAFLSDFCRSCARYTKRQAKLFLNGREPFVCALRFTMVNLVVLCSAWFVFIDQARLAFFPASADLALARTNIVVWCVLVMELLFQVFIRPEGYRALIFSEKAFAPTTVRYINAFHLFVEALSLGIFIPEFLCLFNGQSCGKCLPFSFHNASKIGIVGPSRGDVFAGHAFIALIRLRVFAMVRHWRNFWIANTFVNMKSKARQVGFLSNFVPRTGVVRSSAVGQDRSSISDSKVKAGASKEDEQKKKDATLTNASNIGTALMATNSYRALVCAWAIMGLFPIVFFITDTFQNGVAYEMTDQLQATDLVASDTSEETCQFLLTSTAAWVVSVGSATFTDEDQPYLLTLDIAPYRCAFDGTSPANVRVCELADDIFGDAFLANASSSCMIWSEYNVTDNIGAIAQVSGKREGSILNITRTEEGTLGVVQQDGSIEEVNASYSVTATFDQTYSIQTFAAASLLLQLSLLLLVLGGLSTLRRDAEVLVLGPLRRMLRIVARYARNPLVPPKVSRNISRGRSRRSGRFSQSDESETSSDDSSSDEGESSQHELGSFETEQLITAVAKITDLLRKCWGVAGADIISTNLATREGALTEVFNPTVPGQSVYALFGFAAIGGFDNALRNLGGDVMPLINDVAAVLHGEVFRWGFGDSGQCNKNLGGAFLMVFRIGLVKEVIEKLEQATGVVFGTVSRKTSQVSTAAKRRRNRSTQFSSSVSSGDSALQSSSSLNRGFTRTTTIKGRRKGDRSHAVNPMSLSLHSLPGIGTFTDRAVIGMLKSYAGIYRDKKILNWNDDFRLGAGVGAFNISMIFGMDAGWAVEGAVGSEYKIDATYLSPHVNMASRMTSACKQYDVTIMLSQAVQELMTDVAQAKLRHVDTVTVKGSSVKQKIYTYDAKARGVDFFLYSRSEEQADLEADRYSPSIWQNDQDLKAMRQHITEDFLKIFKEGFKSYTAGDWPTAIQKLEKANDLFFQTAVDEGYLEEEFDALNLRVGTDIRDAAEELKRENGDGPSMCLINFMKSHGGVAPKDWEGWHPLTRK